MSSQSIVRNHLVAFACLCALGACSSKDDGNSAAGSGGLGGLPTAGDGSAGIGLAGVGVAGDGSAGIAAAGNGVLPTAGIDGAGTGGVGAGTGGVGGDGAAGASAGAGAAGTGDTAGTGGVDMAWPAATAFDQTGTFPTTMEAGGSTCTIFRPMTLGEAGRKHPVIVWGNGTTNMPTTYTALFNHFASHGFIVIAANTSNAGSGKEMIDCLDYILMQNTSSGTYMGKVDPDNIAVAGYSQGGAGTLEAGIDPRFKVSLPVSPFIVLPLGGYDSTSVTKQVHPMFMISGSADTVAVPADNQQPIFMQAQVPIIWGTFAGASHLEVIGNGGNYRGPMTAWFRYQLMNDATAKDWFEKPACKLCTAAGWTVMPNSLWK